MIPAAFLLTGIALIAGGAFVVRMATGYNPCTEEKEESS